MTSQVYVGLGGNIGDTVSILNGALDAISKLNGTQDLQCSSFYRTSPVSPVPQNDYVNAVCRFLTPLCPKDLKEALQAIEVNFGKVAKPKSHPRTLDLDILFYGREMIISDDLKIPHPLWQERLFVLKPLSELTDEIAIQDEVVSIRKLLEDFSNTHQETVTYLTNPSFEEVPV